MKILYLDQFFHHSLKIGTTRLKSLLRKIPRTITRLVVTLLYRANIVNIALWNSMAEPGNVSEHDGDRGRLEEVQSEFSDHLHESGTAELEDDQFPHSLTPFNTNPRHSDLKS